MCVPWKEKAWNTPTEAHWGGDGKDRGAAWPDPCRLWRRGHAGRDHATAMALATAHT